MNGIVIWLYVLLIALALQVAEEPNPIILAVAGGWIGGGLLFLAYLWFDGRHHRRFLREYRKLTRK